MAQLIVRKLEDDIVVLLKKRAAEKGHSAEEEHRRILREALLESDGAPKMTLKEYLLHNPIEDPDFELPLPPRELPDEAKYETMFD